MPPTYSTTVSRLVVHTHPPSTACTCKMSFSLVPVNACTGSFVQNCIKTIRHYRVAMCGAAHGGSASNLGHHCDRKRSIVQIGLYLKHFPGLRMRCISVSLHKSSHIYCIEFNFIEFVH